MNNMKMFKSYEKTNDIEEVKFCIPSLFKRNLNLNFTTDADLLNSNYFLGV